MPYSDFILVLTISDKQFNSFHGSMRKQLVRTAIVHLKNKHAEWAKQKSSDKLKKIAEKGIDTAADLNIEENDDVLVFIDYMVVCGEDFYLDPMNQWAKDLRIRNLSGNEKIGRLLKKRPLNITE